MPNKYYNRAKRILRAKIADIDFASLSQKAYGDWINGLPALEFIALLDLHFEKQRQPEPEPEYRAPYTADDPFDTWVDNTGGEQPTTDDTVVWVTYNDGDIGGPNRAGAFLWDDIVSYAVATNVRKAETPKGENDGQN